MMNRKITLFSTFLMLVLQTFTFAQKNSKWNVGVFGGWGKDFLYKKFYGPSSEIPPGSLQHIGSKRSYAIGLSGERFVSPRFTIEARVNYLVSQMPSGHTFNNYTQDYFTKNERHYRALGALGSKYYFNPKAKIIYFSGAGFQGDYFVGFKRFVASYGTLASHDADGYYRFVPSVYATAGVQYWRLQLYAEYQANIANTFSIDEAKLYNNPDILKKSLKRQGVTLNLKFLFVKAGNKQAFSKPE